MKLVTEEYGLVLNLYNTAKHHQETCRDENCTLSMYHLKRAAEVIWRMRIELGAPSGERAEVDKMFKTWATDKEP